MRAVVLTDRGGPEVLRVSEVPDPVPGPDEVLVDIVSSALNRADVLQRLGRYPQPRPVPVHEIPGLEFAGRVAGVGQRVVQWRVGDAVMGIVAGGGYAERVAVHERQVLAVPEGVPLADAGAVPEVWFTAFDALVVQGGLEAGGVALVHAGASGVGTAAIQLAVGRGAAVIVTTSAGKVEACRALGALAIDYGADDFVEVVKEHTAGRGVDVVLDVIGGDYTDRSLRVLAPRGTIVQVGTMAASSVTLDLGLLMAKRARLVGTVLRARPLEEKIALTQRVAREVAPGFTTGRYRAVIDRRFPLEEVAEAHRAMEANVNVGKIVLDIAPQSAPPRR